MNRLSVLAILLKAVSAPAGLAGDAPDRFVAAFFAEHCVGCHGPKTEKGDCRVDTLTVDYDSPRVMAHWEEVMGRVNSGDMPPKGKPRPTTPRPVVPGYPLP